MTRVANYAQFQRTSAHIMDAQERAADFQLRIASGRKSADFAGIARDSGRLVTLESAHMRATQYVKDNKIVETRLKTMETNVAQVYERMSEFRTLLVNALNAENAQDLTMPAQARDVLNQVAGLLNVREDGRYLFAGSATDTIPVDLASLPIAYVVPSADGDSAAYYQGDDVIATLQGDDNLRITYGVTAGDPVFERAIRSLDLVAKGGAGDRATLQHALEIATQVIDELPDVRTRIGASLSAIHQANDKHDQFVLFAEETIGEIENVDVADAITRLNDTQVTLEASYLTLSRLSQLSLLQYLR